MAVEARAQLASEGFDDDHIVFERSINLRYGRQVHELRTPVPFSGPPSTPPVWPASPIGSKRFTNAASARVPPIGKRAWR